MASAPPPPRLPRCELCGGPLVGNFDVVSQHHVGVHPSGRTLWAQPLSGLSAVLCLQCGHTKLFAADVAKIREETEKHPERFAW